MFALSWPQRYKGLVLECVLTNRLKPNQFQKQKRLWLALWGWRINTDPLLRQDVPVMEEEVKDTLEPRSKAGLGAQASWGAELQVSQVHLKGLSPVKMTTENLPCCSSPGLLTKPLPGKLLPLKSLPIRLCFPLPSGSFYHPPLAPFLSHQTQWKLPEESHSHWGHGSVILEALISVSSAGSFSSAKPHHAGPVGLTRYLQGLRWEETSYRAHWGQMVVGR